MRAPVLSLRFEEEVRYPNGDTLMGLEITWPVFDDDGCVVDRTYVDNYPILDSDSTGVYRLDPDGEIALKYGTDYYCEGMDYVDPADRSTRSECFEAADAADIGEPASRAAGRKWAEHRAPKQF